MLAALSATALYLALLPYLKRQTIFRAARNGDVCAVRRLLDGNPSLLNAPDPAGLNTPLYDAIESGQLGVVEVLLERGASTMSARYGPAALFAVERQRREFARWLLAHGEKEDFLVATGLGDIAYMERAIATNPRIVHARGGGIALSVEPMDVAIYAGCAESVRWLAKHGIDPNAKLRCDMIPLELAVDDADLRVVKALIEGGANPNPAGSADPTDTLLASMGRDLSCSPGPQGDATNRAIYQYLVAEAQRHGEKVPRPDWK